MSEKHVIYKLTQRGLKQAKELGHDVRKVIGEDTPSDIYKCRNRFCNCYFYVKKPCGGVGEPYLLGSAMIFPCGRPETKNETNSNV